MGMESDSSDLDLQDPVTRSQSAFPLGKKNVFIWPLKVMKGLVQNSFRLDKIKIYVKQAKTLLHVSPFA